MLEPAGFEAPVAPDVPLPASDPPSPLRAERLSFLGDGREYFRIWIVNAALTVFTLGLYSAWAKVRRAQYFYRNTRLADSSFDYHGDPIAIFKGRLVAGALFGLYTFGGLISPWVTVGAVVLIAVVLPFLLARSLRFRLHNSSYRGLRFRFSGSTAGAYWVFLALPLLTLLSLFTAGPIWHQRIKSYQHGHSSYGTSAFAFNGPVAGFYKIYLGAVGLALMAMVMLFTAFAFIGVLVAIATKVIAPAPGTTPPNAMVVSLAILAVAFGLVVYLGSALMIRAFVAGRVQNLVWLHTQLGAHRFGSSVRTRTLLWITATNLAATVVTLGLFWPFGQIRLARYLASTIWLEPAGSLDDFEADASPEVSAVGEEVAGFFDFDIAF